MCRCPLPQGHVGIETFHLRPTPFGAGFVQEAYERCPEGMAYEQRKMDSRAIQRVRETPSTRKGRILDDED